MRSIVQKFVCLGVMVAVSLIAAPPARASHCDGIDQWSRNPVTNEILRDFQGNQIRNPLRTACDATPHPPNGHINRLFRRSPRFPFAKLVSSSSMMRR